MTSSYFDRTTTYAGLSSMHVGEKSQQLSLCIDTKSKVKANLTITDTNAALCVREAFTSVLYNFRKMFNYKPSDAVSTNGELQNQFDKLGKSYSQQDAWKEHKELMEFMAQYDPNNFVQPDATVTVTDSGVLWEIFNRKSDMGVTIHLKDGFTKKGSWTQGSATCDTSLGLLYSLGQMSMDSLDISIDDAPKLSAGYSGEYTKKERIPLYWPRTWLQLQAYFHNEKPYAVLNRMEAYNLIRFLRLHRPGKVVSGNKQRSLKMQLESGKSPIISVNTFKNKQLDVCERLVCAQKYTGPSVQVETWETDLFWYFEPLLPYIQSLKIMVGGTAQPMVVEADCGVLTFTISALGVSPSNWTRMMEMDTYLDRRDLSSRKDAMAEIQKGMLYYNAFTKNSTKRALLTGLDLDSITFREAVDQKAYKMVYVPTEDLQYSRINAAITKMQTFAEMPNSMDGVEELSKNITTYFAGVAKQEKVDVFVVKSFYKSLFQYVPTMAQILGENKENIHGIIADVENSKKTKEIKQEIREFLFGIQDKRPENRQEGILSKLATALSTRKTKVTQEQLTRLLKVSSALSIAGNSPFAFVDIQNALQEVIKQGASVPKNTLKELLGDKSVVLQKEVSSDRYIFFTNCLVKDGNVFEEPKFSMAPYYKDGGCSCTNTAGGTCVHHKAVWLQHCLDEKSLKEAQKTDPSLVVVQKVNFVELSNNQEKSHSVEQYYHKLTIENNGKSTVRIFKDAQSAGIAFAHQVEVCTIKGYLRVGE